MMRSAVILLAFAASLGAQPVTPPPIAIVSAAGGASVAAPDSILSAFGTDLTTQTDFARSVPLPETLAGITVQVTDSAGVVRPAPLLFASAAQINFILPAGTVEGVADVVVIARSTMVAEGRIPVQSVAPGLFEVNEAGVAAALVSRTVAPNGPSAVFPAFQCDRTGKCSATPLDLGVDAPLTLELFGTGIRGASKPGAVTVTIGGQSMPVQFAGAQSQFPGLDQVNVPLLLTLRGAGLVDVVVTVDGVKSNAVKILIQ